MGYRTEDYRCVKCGTERDTGARGSRTLYACPVCDDVTRHEVVHD